MICIQFTKGGCGFDIKAGSIWKLLGEQQMKIVKLNCIACGAPISVPENLDILFCNSCGSKLAVDRGEGYITLKILEKLTQTIQESGEKAHSAIKENTYVTKVELKKVQISQSISTEEMKLNSLRQEIRQLSRNAQTSLVERSQLTTLRLEQCNSLMRIRKLNLDIARLDEGWDESLEVFQADLASLDEIIVQLTPFSQEPQIATRINELVKERARCQKELITLETNLITGQLLSYSYPPLNTLNVEQLESLRSNIQLDLNLLDRGPQTEVKTSIRQEINGLFANLNAIYPRKIVESSTGELKSLDLRAPFPEIPLQLVPFIDLAESDLAKVKTAPDSPEKFLVQSEIEKLTKVLKDLQAKDIPSQRIKQTQKNKKKQGVLITICLLITACVVIVGILAATSKIDDTLHGIFDLTTIDRKQQQTKSAGQFIQANSEFVEIVALETYLRLEPDINSKESMALTRGDLLFNLGRDSQASDWYKVELVKDHKIGYLYEQWVMPIHSSPHKGTPLSYSNRKTIYEQNFSSFSTDWEESKFDYDYGTGSLDIKDGSYKIELNAKQPAYYFSNISISELPSSYLASVDTKWLSGQGTGYYGLQTNFVDESNFDYLMISTEGDLVVGTYRNGESVVFYNTKDSMNKTVPFNEGGVNKISVLVESEVNNGPTRFTYAVNGYSFYTVEYERWQVFQPKIGLIVWLLAADESEIVSFDNFEITE